MIGESTVQQPPGQQPPRDAYDSLGQMQEAHRDLLRLTRRTEIGHAQAREHIANFLRLGVRTGAILDLPEDRGAAQSLLDYWVSTRETLYPLDSSTRSYQSVEDGVLAAFDPQQSHAAALAAQQLLDRLGEHDRQLLRRVLLRLTWLDPQTRTFSPIEAPVSKLRSLDSAERVDRLLQELQGAGVIRRIDGEGEGDGAVVLKHASLMRNWEPFADALAQRLRFREAAEFWDGHGRDASAAYQSSSLIEESLWYRDLGDLERDFADASQRKRDLARRWRIKVLGGAVAVLSAGVVVLGILAWTAWQRGREIEKQQSELTTKNRDLETARADLQQKVDALTASETALKQSEAELKARTRELEKIVAVARNSEAVVQSQFRDLSFVVNDVLKQKQTLELPDNLKEKVADLQKRYDSVIGQEVPEKEDDVLRPGVRIGPSGGEFFGTAGVFATDGEGRSYLLAPNFLLDDTKGGQPELSAYKIGGSGNGTTIGRFTPLSPSGKNRDVTQLGVARLNDGVEARNEIPGIGSISGIASKAVPGTSVIMIGSTSGMRTGRILEVQPDGTIVTDRISSPGDAGAPVLSADGKLYGLVNSSSENKTYVTPVNRVMQQYGLKLAPIAGQTP